jgi:hypothetical protein
LSRASALAVLVLRVFDATGCDVFGTNDSTSSIGISSSNSGSRASTITHLLPQTEYEGQLMHLRTELAEVTSVPLIFETPQPAIKHVKRLQACRQGYSAVKKHITWTRIITNALGHVPCGQAQPLIELHCLTSVALARLVAEGVR